MTELDFIHTKWNGVRVKKHSGKPFKSGLSINTIKDLCINPNTGKIAFQFNEDESCVDCWQCGPAVDCE